MIIVTTGGREHEIPGREIEELFAPYAQPGNVLVLGGARGWDEDVRKLWHYKFQLPYVVEPAPWNSTGKAAGGMRNTNMVRGTSLAPHAHLPPDLVVAGPGGRGTTNCTTQAERRGLDVVYFA